MSVKGLFAVGLLVALLLTLCLPTATAAADPVPGPEHQPGFIQVTTNPTEAEVFVNGTKMNGTTPLTLKVPSMVPQEVVVVKYGYESDRRIVTVPPNGTVPLDLTLRSIDGGNTVPRAPGGMTTPAAGPAGTWEEAPLSPAAVLVALLLLGLVAAARQR
jgi:hypothetical protein